MPAARPFQRCHNDKFIVHKLFDEVAPRYAERPGGYTRIVKLGPRRSDCDRDGVPRARLSAGGSYRLDIEYDGSAFSGWARQPGLRTVQGELEAALATVLREPIGLTVAGRTDAGVHALGQVASFATAVEVPADLGRRLDGLCPGSSRSPPPARRRPASTPVATPSPAATSTGCTCAGRRARSSAVAPSAGRTRSTARRSTPAPRALLGRHDFTAFTPTQTDHVHFERVVLGAGWTAEPGDLLAFRITADAFMRGMVRALVGTMLEVSSGRRERRGLRPAARRRPALGGGRDRARPRPLPGVRRLLLESFPVRILLTNDDGITAPGLQATRRALRELEDVELDVIAPNTNRSAHRAQHHHPLSR